MYASCDKIERPSADPRLCVPQVELHKRQRLAPYDVALKGFRYHDALDQALQSKHPRTIVAVMEELLMRRVRTQIHTHRGKSARADDRLCESVQTHTPVVPVSQLDHWVDTVFLSPLPCAHLVSLIPPPHRV